MNMRINKGWVGITALAMVLSLHGCGGGDEDTSSTASQIVVNTPAAIAQVSADDYEANVNGLITAATLKRWKDDWATERAKLGLTGKLIIFQTAVGPAGAEYIKPNGTNVFTYLSPANSEWVQTRSNGVIESQSVVPDGTAMDAILKKYNIDPRNDMIVAAMGLGSNPNAMGQGRIWYALRYWGVDKKNLAIMNGGNKWGAAFAPTFTSGDYSTMDSSGVTTAQTFADGLGTYPNTGTISVKSLMVDNTQLQATLDDMLRILPSSDTNNKADGVLIWDARSMGQYTAGLVAERFERSCATAYCVQDPASDYMWSFQNSGSRQGHPNGTLQLQYTHFLDDTKGFSYRPKAFLAKLLNGGITTVQDVTDGNAKVAGIGFVDGSYGTLGAGNAYQEGDTIYAYCETTFRAMITGVASAVILGKPTRFYDGAMVEWNSLTYTADAKGDYILPFNSPWRTDVVSFFRGATDAGLIHDGLNGTVPNVNDTRTITDPHAANANVVVNADKAYKTGVTGGGGSGGAPANPCGG